MVNARRIVVHMEDCMKINSLTIHEERLLEEGNFSESPLLNLSLEEGELLSELEDFSGEVETEIGPSLPLSHSLPCLVISPNRVPSLVVGKMAQAQFAAPDIRKLTPEQQEEMVEASRSRREGISTSKHRSGRPRRSYSSDRPNPDRRQRCREAELLAKLPPHDSPVRSPKYPYIDVRSKAYYELLKKDLANKANKDGKYPCPAPRCSREFDDEQLRRRHLAAHFYREICGCGAVRLGQGQMYDHHSRTAKIVKGRIPKKTCKEKGLGCYTVTRAMYRKLKKEHPEIPLPQEWPMECKDPPGAKPYTAQNMRAP